MVYFTIRERPEGEGGPGSKTKLFYSYADEDFTTLATEPKLLFEYPDPDVQVLDALGDLCKEVVKVCPCISLEYLVLCLGATLFSKLTCHTLVFDSVEDIAKRCSFTVSKVKNMLFRTRNKLKDYLIREGVEL